MDEALLAAYRATDYRVRLTGGGWASIRIDSPLPDTLRDLTGYYHWGFITAWNPLSQPQSRARNQLAQKQLLQRLKQMPHVRATRAAVGVGSNGWHERSLFVVGPPASAFDALGQAFGQNAYVHGDGQGFARLRLLAAPG
ncbi:DUF3293 domain-containing protein [Dyella silvae]|uniref:DUF3293 domain-containing protein n=1 Tax=Dyella silvae TaxID=2994424 RepID=UPI002264B4FD|nr:DUF3293 domain-containing protein [Dyella silvae]